MYTSTQPELSDDIEVGAAVASNPAKSGGSSQAGASMAPAVDSSDLLRGNKAVTIQHNGSVYRLQATKLGKLILTK